MFVVGNLLSALSQVLDAVVDVFMWLIFIRVLISWVNPDPGNMVVIFLYRVTEPILAPFRRLTGNWNIGIDLSPFFAVLFLMFLRIFLIQTLLGIAYRLQ